MHLRSVFSAVFVCVPAFALVSLGTLDSPFRVSAELKQGVEVLPVSQNATEVVNLSDWQYTSCSQPMDGLDNWQYNGDPEVGPNCAPQDRSACTRPCVNIYIVNMDGECRMFGSRMFAGGGCQSVPVTYGACANPVGFQNPNGMSGFDIPNLFRAFVASRVQAPGGLFGAGLTGSLLGSDGAEGNVGSNSAYDMYAEIARSLMNSNRKKK